MLALKGDLIMLLVYKSTIKNVWYMAIKKRTLTRLRFRYNNEF